MKPWPRTLFYRNLLLILGLIVAAQVAGALLFRELVMKPRVRAAAQTAAHHVEALEAGLAGLPHDVRKDFIARMNTRMNERMHAPVHDASSSESEGRRRRLSPLEQAYVDQLSQSLAAKRAQVSWHRDAGHVLSVQVVLDGDPYLMAMPGLVGVRGLPKTWVIGSVITVLLAMAGAWWMQRRLNRPLNQLAAAADVMAQGRMPPLLPEDGPIEIAKVSRGFNAMASSIAEHEQERALMLAGLSHDLRTPLTKMRLVIEMLRGQGDAELLASLERNIEGLDHLLNQFMDFTRASLGIEGRQEAVAEALACVDLNELVRETVAQCMPDQVSQGHVQVQLAFAGGLPACHVPVLSLKRALQNLLVNAQRHGAPPIEVATQALSGAWVRIEVRDRGAGIPPERIHAVRKAFEQGDAARGHAQPGAGLGLAIVDRIAARWGARADLLPREGGGLIARIDWPVQPPTT